MKLVWEMLMKNSLALNQSTSQDGKWYSITFGWSETSYYARSVKRTLTARVVYIPQGGSIARHTLSLIKEFRESGMIYSREERGIEDVNWRCLNIVELALLLPDGQKITGFKPKSLAKLFSQESLKRWEELIFMNNDY